MALSEREKIRTHIDHLGNEKTFVRARYYLYHYGSRASEDLVEALNRPDMITRVRAAMLLGYTRDPRAFEVLVSLLDDPMPEMRYDAAAALGELEDVRAVDLLIQRNLDTTDSDSSLGAGEGLGRLGAVAIPGLEKLLTTSDAKTREWVQERLEYLRSPDYEPNHWYSASGRRRRLLKRASAEEHPDS